MLWRLLVILALVLVGCSSKTASGATSSGGATTAKAAKVGTRDNPVPFGDGYEFKKSGRTYTITVTDQDDDATGRVKAANMLNADPPDGNTYVATRLKVEYTDGSKDQPFQTPTTGYEYEAGNRRWGAPPLSVAEEPKFSGQNIFPGADLDGWLGGKYMPSDLVEESVLVFDGVYFALR